MDEEVHQRMQIINTMLLEMASGNFFYRIERSSKSDDIEALIVTLNMLAEEIQDAIVHQGYANSNTTSLDIVQMSFIIDTTGYVRMVNQKTCNLLSCLQSDIIGKPFESLLAHSCQPKWNAKWKKIRKKKIFVEW
jgi:signal transduction histidine kinase